MYIFISCTITVVITLSVDYNPHAFPCLILPDGRRAWNYVSAR